MKREASKSDRDPLLVGAFLHQLRPGRHSFASRTVSWPLSSYTELDWMAEY